MATTTSQSQVTPVTAFPETVASFPDIGVYVLPLISSPTNIILFMILLYVVYLRLRPAATLPPIMPDEPIVFAYYTPLELSEFDGRKNQKILMGIRGRVYDVSAGRRFYGPEGPYGNFAGRDASRGLSKGSFDEGKVHLIRLLGNSAYYGYLDMITPLDQPMDPLHDMTPEEQQALEDWEEHFKVILKFGGYSNDV